MFLSQRPNNDPEPWVDVNGGRHVDDWATLRTFDPRPEFTQTRDPKPWLAERLIGNFRLAEHSPAWRDLVWSPRHEEFDTPVNPILAEFRHNLRTNPSLGLGLAEGYLRWSEGGSGEPTWTAEERDHARRVLSKLLAVYSG